MADVWGAAAHLRSGQGQQQRGPKQVGGQQDGGEVSGGVEAAVAEG